LISRENRIPVCDGTAWGRSKSLDELHNAIGHGWALRRWRQCAAPTALHYNDAEHDWQPQCAAKERVMDKNDSMTRTTSYSELSTPLLMKRLESAQRDVDALDPENPERALLLENIAAMECALAKRKVPLFR
jgi:hypothetical protein